MKNLKSIFLIILWLFIFFIVEGIGALIAIFYKISTNIEYAEKLNNALNSYKSQGNEIIEDFLNIINEVTPEALFITGILVTIPLVIYFIIKKQNPYKKIKIQKIGFLFGIAVIGNIIISLLLNILPQNLINDHSQATGYIEEIPFIPLLISVGIIGPVIEEIFFRYLMMKKVDNKYIAIILPAFLFGVAHGNIVQGTYAFLTGVVFGYIYFKTKNLSYSTIMHVTLNSSSAFAVYLPKTISIILAIIIVSYTFGYLIIMKKNNENINIFS